MLIPCSRARVVVAEPGIRLERQTPGSMVWDEHGGTFILRVDELASRKSPPSHRRPASSWKFPCPGGRTHWQPGRVRRPAGTPAVPTPGPGTAGGSRPGGLSPAGAQPVRLCGRAAPGGQTAGGGRGNCGNRPLQGSAGSLPGNRPGHPPHQGGHGPVGGLSAQPGPGFSRGGPGSALAGAIPTWKPGTSARTCSWRRRPWAWGPGLSGPSRIKPWPGPLNCPRPMSPSWLCRWGINLRGRKAGRMETRPFAGRLATSCTGRGQCNLIYNLVNSIS